MKKTLSKKQRFLSLSTLIGIITLPLVSMIQKIAIGFDPFMLQGYIMPAVLGGIIGRIIGGVVFKNTQLIQQLKNTNESLENQVKTRTKELNDRNKQLENISNTDALTSIANRRHLDSCLKLECKRLSRNTSHLSLIMCDIDHFKLINDNHGHQLGDECLKSVASVLSSIKLRESDLIARYGGEEFVIVLPDTKLEMALRLAERARKLIEKLHITHKNTTHKELITVSFGVTSLRSEDNHIDGAEALISKADQALYAAKKAGRNKVIALKISGLFKDKKQASSSL